MIFFNHFFPRIIIEIFVRSWTLIGYKMDRLCVNIRFDYLKNCNVILLERINESLK